MSSLLAGTVWLGLVAWLLARAISHFRAHAGSALQPAQPHRAVPAVTVIVPARNEAENIRPCLAALSGQAGLGAYEILVVDDESRDGTAAITRDCAARDGRIRLIHAGPLPEGWAGKPHACWRGALAARGEWLCFVDADVRAEAGLLAAAMQTSGAKGIDMLSLLPFQELGSAWECLVVPAGMVMIACAMNRGAVDDPASPAIAANGQFILVRRDAYFAVGGHASVRNAIAEDKTLAEQVKRAGFRFRLLSAEGLARTRMYRDLPSLWEGFTKNAVDILGSAGATVSAATAGMLAAWTAALLPVGLALQAALGETSWAAWAGAALAACGSAIVLSVQLGTCRHLRVPLGLALLFPLGATMCAVLAWRSALLRRHGEVAWKGRRYGTVRRLPKGSG